MWELYSIYSSVGLFHVWIFKHKHVTLKFNSFCWASFPTNDRNLISANSGWSQPILAGFMSTFQGYMEQQSLGWGGRNLVFGQGFLSMLTLWEKPKFCCVSSHWVTQTVVLIIANAVFSLQIFACPSWTARECWLLPVFCWVQQSIIPALLSGTTP